LAGFCYLLVDGGEAVLVDTGMIGEPIFIRGQMRRLGLAPHALKAILLTHGHIDHAGNLKALQEWSGAKAYAHPGEALHVAGRYPYTGIVKWCGRLEALARFLIRFRPGTIDVPIHDGDVLPFWGGLKAIHLPGHTQGHCGFYSEKHSLLFCGDMFASIFFFAHKPPAILNTVPEFFDASIEKVRRLAPRAILPCHCDWPDGELNRRRFAKAFRIPDWIDLAPKCENR
jgi:glyoxylase-like metal-dependent hydrolase (beta-lactamase superfamily II)